MILSVGIPLFVQELGNLLPVLIAVPLAIKFGLVAVQLVHVHLLVENLLSPLFKVVDLGLAHKNILVY